MMWTDGGTSYGAAYLTAEAHTPGDGDGNRQIQDETSHVTAEERRHLRIGSEDHRSGWSTSRVAEYATNFSGLTVACCFRPLVRRWARRVESVATWPSCSHINDISGTMAFTTEHEQFRFTFTSNTAGNMAEQWRRSRLNYINCI